MEDDQIESIQAGFPDCIARRQITKTRWEELRIEFEYESRSFVAHKHDPDQVDMIICWRHNWKDCPEWIEVIEISSLINNLEDISEEVTKDAKKLTEYQEFCREKRLEGLEFKGIARLWQKLKSRKQGEKGKREDNLEDTAETRKLTELFLIHLAVPFRVSIINATPTQHNKTIFRFLKKFLTRIAIHNRYNQIRPITDRADRRLFRL